MSPAKKLQKKTPLSQETEKPQEVTLEEQQEGPVSSLTLPKEGEEVDWVLDFSRLKIGTRDQQQVNHKYALEEKKG